MDFIIKDRMSRGKEKIEGEREGEWREKERSRRRSMTGWSPIFCTRRLIVEHDRSFARFLCTDPP